ncbi:MAG: hypothetical protein MUF36_05000 [Bacteroidales bacterium]|jgi:hypothetical protein|nr:hypothetical protein [Bacteroidales bacterium]
MKRSIVFFICTLILFGSITAQKVGYSILKGKYFGQKTPGKTPEVFADGIVSVSGAKYIIISFSGSMDEFYLYSWNGNKAELLFSKIDNGVWASLQDAGFAKGYKAWEPHITYKGDMIFFIWDKPLITGGQETPFKIWVSKRTPEGWSEPDYEGIGMFVSSDREGNIYTTDMTSIMTTGKTYLAKVKVENGKFIAYEKLQIPEFYGSQAHPCIAPDGSYILFDVDSGHHLFVSFINCQTTHDDFPVLSGPYLGQTPPGSAPKVFASGIVSTSMVNHSCITVSPDGTEIYWIESKIIED